MAETKTYTVPHDFAAVLKSAGLNPQYYVDEAESFAREIRKGIEHGWAAHDYATEKYTKAMRMFTDVTEEIDRLKRIAGEQEE